MREPEYDTYLTRGAVEDPAPHADDCVCEPCLEEWAREQAEDAEEMAADAYPVPLRPAKTLAEMEAELDAMWNRLLKGPYR